MKSSGLWRRVAIAAVGLWALGMVSCSDPQPTARPQGTLLPVPPSPTLASATRLPTATARPITELAEAPSIGARAPGFSLPALNGEQISLASLRGRPVLLNFWATW